jgi:hypothetical protein
MAEFRHESAIRSTGMGFALCAGGEMSFRFPERKVGHDYHASHAT